MSQEVAGFLAIAEDYPDLRSADQFLELQAQLEGTENRINVARIRFNGLLAGREECGECEEKGRTHGAAVLTRT